MLVDTYMAQIFIAKTAVVDDLLNCITVCRMQSMHHSYAFIIHHRQLGTCSVCPGAPLFGGAHPCFRNNGQSGQICYIIYVPENRKKGLVLVTIPVILKIRDFFCHI